MVLGTAVLPLHSTLRTDDGQRSQHQDEEAGSSFPQDFPWHPDKAQTLMALDNYPQTIWTCGTRRGHPATLSPRALPVTWENQCLQLLEACLGSSSEMFSELQKSSLMWSIKKVTPYGTDKNALLHRKILQGPLAEILHLKK